MTPQAISGLLINPQDAATLIRAIDNLAELTWQRRKRLEPGLVKLRYELADYLTCASTDARKHPNRPTPPDNANSQSGIVDTATAAKQLNITQSGVRDLCKRQRLTAMKVDGQWWIAEPSIADHARTRKDTENDRTK